MSQQLSQRWCGKKCNANEGLRLSSSLLVLTWTLESEVYVSELFSFSCVCHEFLKRCCLNMSQLSKYGATWRSKWLWQMLSSCRSLHSLLLCLRRQTFKFYRSHMGKIKPFKGIIEQRLEIIEPLLGITKPAEGINKSYLVDFVISSADSKTETSVTARRTSVKAVDSLSYALICLRSNLLDSYYLKIIFSDPILDIGTNSFVYNYYYLRKSLSWTFCEMMNIVVAAILCGRILWPFQNSETTLGPRAV